MAQYDPIDNPSAAKIRILQSAISELCSAYDIPVRFDGKHVYLSDGSREWFFHILQRPTLLNIHRWLHTEVPLDESKQMVVMVQNPTEAISHVHSLRSSMRTKEAVEAMKEKIDTEGGLERFLILTSEKRPSGFSGLLKKLELSATQFHIHCESKMQEFPVGKFIGLCEYVSLDPKILRRTLLEE